MARYFEPECYIPCPMCDTGKLILSDDIALLVCNDCKEFCDIGFGDLDFDGFESIVVELEGDELAMYRITEIKIKE